MDSVSKYSVKIGMRNNGLKIFGRSGFNDGRDQR